MFSPRYAFGVCKQKLTALLIRNRNDVKLLHAAAEWRVACCVYETENGHEPRRRHIAGGIHGNVYQGIYSRV